MAFMDTREGGRILPHTGQEVCNKVFYLIVGNGNCIISSCISSSPLPMSGLLILLQFFFTCVSVFLVCNCGLIACVTVAAVIIEFRIRVGRLLSFLSEYPLSRCYNDECVLFII